MRRSTSGLSLAVLLLGGALGVAIPALADSFSFTTLDVPGTNSFTGAYGINSVGQIVGVFRDTGGKLHGFLRTAGGTSSRKIARLSW